MKEYLKITSYLYFLTASVVQVRSSLLRFLSLLKSFTLSVCLQPDLFGYSKELQFVIVVLYGFLSCGVILRQLMTGGLSMTS